VTDFSHFHDLRTIEAHWRGLILLPGMETIPVDTMALMRTVFAGGAMSCVNVLRHRVPGLVSNDAFGLVVHEINLMGQQ
jgi:hypothetical protein